MSLEYLLELNRESAKREREGLKIYRPSAQQSPFHRNPCPEAILRGGKRSGKSMAIAAEFSRRVTGLPLCGVDGKEIPNPFPKATLAHPRIYWVIGWDTDHIGQTVHKLLFQPGVGGQFRCIQDLDTGRWRAWNRADPTDAKRYKESQLTESFIPDRMIIPESWEWEDKRANHFKRVCLTNGATIFAYPSSSRNPKQGDAVSGIWIDEDIMFPRHLKEWQDRLTDEEGWFLWSVWPHNKNDALMKLLDRAEAAEEDEKPQIRSFQLAMTSNPYLTDKGKRESLGRMESDEEIARRNLGDLLTDTVSMYNLIPEHHLIRRDNAKGYQPPSLPHEIIRNCWLDTNTLPNEWTRYLAVDPSHTRTAVLSFAVTPPILNGHPIGSIAIVEWELVVKKYSAKMLAEELYKRCGGVWYEAFIMDQNAGRQTSIGREETTLAAYEMEFRKVRLASRSTGHGFIPGCNITSTRYRNVRDMLAIDDQTGTPRMLLIEEQCILTKKEFGTYRKKTLEQGDGDLILDIPANPRIHDCMSALEYGCAYLYPLILAGGAYVEPSMYRPKGSMAYHHAMKLLGDANKNQSFVNLGPAGA